MFNNMMSIGKDDVIVVYGENDVNLNSDIGKIKAAFPDNEVIVLSADAIRSIGVIKKEPDMSALMDMFGGASRSNLTTNAAPIFSL